MIKHVEPQTGGIEIRKRKKKLTMIIRHILARRATCVPSERIFLKQELLLILNYLLLAPNLQMSLYFYIMINNNIYTHFPKYAKTFKYLQNKVCPYSIDKRILKRTPFPFKNDLYKAHHYDFRYITFYFLFF